MPERSRSSQWIQYLFLDYLIRLGAVGRSYILPAMLLCCWSVLVLAASSRAQNKPPISEEIAKAYGLDSWSQIGQVRYTFNIDLPGFKLSRSWVWEPKTGRVSYNGKDKDGNPARIFFSDVAVKLTGSNDWMNAQ